MPIYAINAKVCNSDAGLWQGLLDTVFDQAYHTLYQVVDFLRTPVSFTNKCEHHDLTE